MSKALLVYGKFVPTVFSSVAMVVLGLKVYMYWSGFVGLNAETQVLSFLAYLVVVIL